MLFLTSIIIVFLSIAYYKVSKNDHQPSGSKEDNVIATIKLAGQLFVRTVSSIINVTRALTGNGSIYDAVKELNGSSNRSNNFQNNSSSSINAKNDSQELQANIHYCVTCENWGGSREPTHINQYVSYQHGTRGRCHIEKPHVQITYDTHHNCNNWQKWRALN